MSLAGWARRSRRAVSLAVTAAGLVLSACQTAPTASLDAPAAFAGRLGIRVDGDAQRSFSASFELHGDAHTGWLGLSSPLGTQLGRADWSPDRQAQLQTSDGLRRYSSLESLAQDLTGQPLPIAAWFDWLAGRPWPAAASRGFDGAQQPGFSQLGWDVQLDRLTDGVIVAIREQPAPRVTVRAKLDAR